MLTANQFGIAQSWWTPDFKMGVEHSQRLLEEDVAWLPHTHAEYAFIFCLAGRMEFLCGGEHHVLEPGEMLVHNAGQVHQSYYGTGQSSSEGIALILHASVIEGLLTRMRVSYRSHLDRVMFLGKARDEEVTRLVRDLIAELRRLGLGYDLVVQSLVVQILVHLFRHALEPSVLGTRPNLPPQLPAWESIKAMRYMSAHGKKDFSLAELCAELGTSPSRFIPLFRNSTQLNPHTYFDRVLIQRAQKLLGSGQRAVKEVAYQLGFQNPSHFCRVFHSVAGTTPKLFQLLRAGEAASRG